MGIGVGVSLFTLIARAAQTQFVVLGWVPGTSAYHDIKVMEVAQPVPEQVVLRFDADMWEMAAKFQPSVGASPCTYGMAAYAAAMALNLEVTPT